MAKDIRVRALLIWARSVIAASADEDGEHSLVLRAEERFVGLDGCHERSVQRLGRLFALTHADRRVVALLFALALEPEAVPGSRVNSHFLSIVLALHSDCCQAFGCGARLRDTGIIERTDGLHAQVHESRRTCALADRVVGWLHGEDRIEPEVARLLCFTGAPAGLSCFVGSDETLRNAQNVRSDGRGIVVAVGAPGLGRRTLLAAIANDAGVRTMQVDCRRLAKEPLALARQLQLIARECKLLERAPLLCNVGELVDDKDQTRLDLVGSELVAELDTNVYVT